MGYVIYHWINPRTDKTEDICLNCVIELTVEYETRSKVWSSVVEYDGDEYDMRSFNCNQCGARIFRF